MVDEADPVPGGRLFGQLLHDVDRLMQRRLDQYTRRFGMTRAQWRAMAVLDARQGCNQRELAEALSWEPITLARLLDRLCDAGLVERVHDKRDRRAWRLRLTSCGAEAVSRMRQCARDYESECLAGLSQADIATMRRQLLALNGNLAHAISQSAPTDARETAVPGRHLDNVPT